MSTLDYGHYTTGTVSVTVNSKAVSGVGTAWKNVVNPGDMLSVDDKSFYFVESVTDNTHLTLDKPFREATASGKAYRIVLMIGSHFPADTAAKVAKTLEVWNGFANLLGVANGIAPLDGTGKVDTRYLKVTTNPYATDVNFIPNMTTISELIKLVVLKSQLSSTGGADKVLVSNNDGKLHESLVFESGGNSNGIWLKLVNGWGIAVCYKNSVTGGGWINSSGHYYSPEKNATLPMTFLQNAIPLIAAEDAQVASRSAWITYAEIISGQTLRLCFSSTAPAHKNNLYFRVAVIGLWK